MGGRTEQTRFGVAPDGRAVEAVTLSNGAYRARILTYGAILQSLRATDRSGAAGSVVLGFEDLDGYLADRAFIGATIGRYANRIAQGRFALDGQVFQLTRNDGANCLHGGAGFHKRLWDIADIGEGSVRLEYISPDGEDGFPGALTAGVTYALSESGELSIDLSARTDTPTVVCMTHHSYFNLAGAGTALDQRLTIPAEAFTPVDSALIPTGELRPVAGTTFDFRRPRRIGSRDYDHNWVVSRAGENGLGLCARLDDPMSGRTLDVLSNQPGLQFYSGRGDGVCLEPQLFPDTPNQPAFGSARLDPGQVYRNRILLRLGLLD